MTGTTKRFTVPARTRLNGIIRLCWSLAVVFVSSVAMTGVAVAGEDSGLGHNMASRLQQILDSAAANEDSRYPGVILRLATPNGVWTGTSGVSNIETGSDIDPDARFRCGSILKPFISVVILQLVEEGRLSLDDQLTDLLETEITGLFEYSDSITVKMLLNHTSGIGEWTGAGYEALYNMHPADYVWSEKEFLTMASKAGTEFKPGERWLYNNTEYNLLGVIIESKTGKSWRDNIRQRIFTRLELKDTFLPEPGDRKIPGSHVNGYEQFSTGLTDTSEVDPSMAGAAGGHALVSNTRDLAIFIEALLDGVLFKEPETLSAMLTFVETGDPRRNYGLGIGRYPLPDGGYALGHTGGTAGYATFMFRLPNEQITATSVMTTDQGEAMVGYLLPALEALAENAQE